MSAPNRARRHAVRAESPGVTDSTPTDAAELLSQAEERIQTVTIGEKPAQKTVIVSVLDQTIVGGGTAQSLSDDWSTASGSSSLGLFAEEIVLTGLKADNLVLGAHLLTGAGTTVKLDVSGRPGADATPTPGQTEGGDGGPGSPAGSLALYLEDFDPNTALPPPVIHAMGGQGGSGGPGPGNPQGPGGNGGTGGDSGAVTARVSHPALRWVVQLQSILAEASTGKGMAAARADLAALVGTWPASTPWSDIKQSLDDGALSPTAGATVFCGGVKYALTEVYNLAQAWAAGFVNSVNISGGAPGTYGRGDPDGSNGARGTAGTRDVEATGQLADPSMIEPAFSIHPAQVAMAMAKARLAYWVADPVADPASVQDVTVLLNRILQRTAPFTNLTTDSPLAQFYAAGEADFGAVNSVASLAALHGQAAALLNQISTGKDYFGYAHDYVPMSSLSVLLKGFGSLLGSFTTIETAYHDYFTALAQQTITDAQVTQSWAAISSNAAAFTADIDDLKNLMEQDVTAIDCYQQALPAMLDALNSEFKTFEEQIGEKLNLQWSALLPALGQLAFAPESALMWIAQGAQIGYTAATTVTDADGTPVRKDLLLDQVLSVQNDMSSISTGYQELDDGTISPDDPGAGMLIADASQMMQYLTSLYGQFPTSPQGVVDLVEALRDYVGAVTARNSKILEYNACVNLVAQYQMNQQQIEDRRAELTDQVIEGLAADNVAMCAFISRGTTKPGTTSCG